SKPFKVVVEQDQQSVNHLWTLRVKHKIPCVYAPIIGDVIHNLRASLDLLATEAVAKSGGNPNNVYFPFGNDEAGLDEMIKNRHIDRAGNAVVALVKSFKPYKGGNTLLRALHDLDITDKHKSLIPVAHYAGIKNFQMANASGPMLSIQDMHCGPIRDGMILMSLPPANNVIVGQSFQPSLKLTLNEEALQNETDQDLIQTLNSLVSLVEDMITQFVTHFESYENEKNS
ncbi:MAG: hypothetical protein ACJAS1_006324, partial [Oleiphilaceae bacterium]